MTKLATLYREWSEWSKTAGKREDGWQSSFPKWDSLMKAAALEMTAFSESRLELLERCWAISEEGEELADYAREHIVQCWDALLHLRVSADSRVRWQVYSVLDAGGQRSVPLLVEALDDPDNYSRRRAILALGRLAPTNAKQLAETLLEDRDPYIRRAAIELIRHVKDPRFVREAKRQLLVDPAEHVRAAARKEL